MNVLSLYLPEIRELVAGKDFPELRRALARIDAVDLAEGWEAFSPEEQAALFRLMPRRKAAVLFEELEPEHQGALLQHLREVDLKELVSDLDPTMASRLLPQLPEKMTKHFLSLMKKDSLVTIEKLMEYPPSSVGGRMRTRLFLIRPEWTVKAATERLQVSARLRHVADLFLDQLYVAGEDGRLRGMVQLKELIVAPGDLKVAELSHRPSTVLTPEMDQEEAGRLFQRYKLESAPVVDAQERILGVVLAKDMIEVLQEETEEDFAKMAGATRAGLEGDSALGVARLRFPWLIATCVGQLAVSSVVRHYEDVLSRMLAIATFMPFIAAMGGNVGTQSATVTVRGMATGDIPPGRLGRAVWREVRAGGLLGAFYGLVVGVFAHVLYGDRFGWLFSLVVMIGMIVSMTVASTMGALWPVMLQRLGHDPATATGPLITTTTDLISTSTYLALAGWCLYRFWG